MSPLGKLLLSVCDENMSVNMTHHWRTFYLAGFNKNHVEKHASSIGIDIVHANSPALDSTKVGGTIVGMKPVQIGRYTLLGIPAPKVL